MLFHINPKTFLPNLMSLLGYVHESELIKVESQLELEREIREELLEELKIIAWTTELYADRVESD